MNVKTKKTNDKISTVENEGGSIVTIVDDIVLGYVKVKTVEEKNGKFSVLVTSYNEKPEEEYAKLVLKGDHRKFHTQLRKAKEHHISISSAIYKWGIIMAENITLPALVKLFSIQDKRKHIIYNYLDEFFEKATPTEEYLFKCYLDPNVRSNVGPGFSDAARTTQHLPGEVISDPVVVFDTCRESLAGSNEMIRIIAALYRGLTSEEINAFEVVLTKRPIGFSYTTVNNYYKYIHGYPFIERFQVQLAATYDRFKKYKVDHFYATPKLDGLRCYYNNKDKKLYTRNNKEHMGFEHINKICDNLCEKFNLDYIDGELYSHELDFQRLNGVIRRQDSVFKAKIKYVIFAAVGKEIKNTANMYDILAMMANELPKDCNVEIIESYIIPAEYTFVKELAGRFVQEGYEGVMLRHPDVYYDFRRSNALLKFKFFNEDDFVIVGTFEGKNKYEGMLGGIIVKRGDDITAEVGSGFTDEEREFLWATRDYLIGRIVEIRYQELTDSGKSLRFPTFSKFK